MKRAATSAAKVDDGLKKGEEEMKLTELLKKMMDEAKISGRRSERLLTLLGGGRWSSVS
jgi:hypothetical protein